MARSPSPTDANVVDPTQLLQQFIEENAEDPDKEQVISEIQVLQSIFGDNAVRLYAPSPPAKNHTGEKEDKVIRYEVELGLPSPYEDVSLKVLVSLPPTYPSSSPPQLQLLSRYIGRFGADSSLFGAVLRTYISVSGVEWSKDTVCVFDGLQNVLDRCTSWYEDHLNAEQIAILTRKDGKENQGGQKSRDNTSASPSRELEDEVSGAHETLPLSLPTGIELHVSEPIVDRKSVFIGRACQIHHPSEVPIVLSHLMADKRIARAAHPIINAWRCEVASVVHQDNDDDGETAAGARLAHLLQILEVNNVLVIVTRYFGGIHLGPDRFKHINQAARNALEVGGFLENGQDTNAKKHQSRSKKT